MNDYTPDLADIIAEAAAVAEYLDIEMPSRIHLSYNTPTGGSCYHHPSREMWICPDDFVTHDWRQVVAHEMRHHYQDVTGQIYRRHNVLRWEGLDWSGVVMPYRSLPWEADAFKFESEWMEYRRQQVAA